MLLTLLLYLAVPFITIFKKIVHLLILVVILYIFCSLTLTTTHWISLLETYYKPIALNISPDSGKLESFYNFINRGIKTDIRTFRLSSKVNQLRQEFLPTHQYKEISMLTIDYSPATLMSICLLIIYVYILFIQQVIIF